MSDIPIKIGMIMGKWVGGGVEAVVMNYYHHIDRSKIQFDFICDEDSTDIPYDEIEKLGGRVIICPPYQKLPKYLKALKRLFRDNNYKIVHSNINTLSVFPLMAAKLAKVPIRIAHSHSTTNKKERKKNLFKQLLRPFSKLFATHYLCCSESAGRWMFGNKAYDMGNVFLLNNAIEFEKFKYNRKDRNIIRKKYNIDSSTIVFGHVGRFVSTKNHIFILNAFSSYCKINPNSLLLLIGQGKLMETMKKYSIELGIENKVLFLGQIEDVYRFYNSMDILLLPSLYEGLGLVAIEAQANSLPCVVSKNVPVEASISNGIEFVGLDESIDCWINKIICLLKLRGNLVYFDNAKKYNIDLECKKLENYYLKLLERKI